MKAALLAAQAIKTLSAKGAIKSAVALRWLARHLQKLWQWWRYDIISVRLASVYIVLLSALFFQLGHHRPPAQYGALQDNLDSASADIRKFSSEITRRNGLLNNMRARDNLNRKTIDLLNARIEQLEHQALRWQEETAFYQHVLENRTPGGNIVIHALDASPDFTRQGWKLSAILARPGKRRAFRGSYYFEIVEASDNGEHAVTRLPAIAATEFRMNFYLEIEEHINLSPDKTIENLRLVILDSKGNDVATSEMGSQSELAAANGNGNGNGGNGFGNGGNGNGYGNGNGNGAANGNGYNGADDSVAQPFIL